MPISDRPWEESNPGRVTLLGPVCVSYGHPDLGKTHGYLSDFGLVKDFEQVEDGVTTVYYRGYGTQPAVYIARETSQPRFLGAFFEAGSEEDLQKAAQLPGAGAVHDFMSGGQAVTVTDPTGMPFHVVFGHEKRPFTPHKPELKQLNYPSSRDDDAGAKPRRGEFQRLSRGPTPVHKLGHCGYLPRNMDEAVDFYCTHFNFKPSDILQGDDGTTFLVFMHVDMGKKFSDHHAFFLARPFGTFSSEVGGVHHAAFEVESIDTTFTGHEHLHSKGYKPFWGVGRHIEGSQVFDYWYDLDGFVVEHYADGDLVNEDNPVGYIKGRPAHLGNNWGPPPVGMPPVSSSTDTQR